MGGDVSKQKRKNEAGCLKRAHLDAMERLLRRCGRGWCGVEKEQARAESHGAVSPSAKRDIDPGRKWTYVHKAKFYKKYSGIIRLMTFTKYPSYIQG